MLVLNRKIGESFTIDGNIKIKILSNYGIVRIGIEAPRYRRVVRDESIVPEQTDDIKMARKRNQGEGYEE